MNQNLLKNNNKELQKSMQISQMLKRFDENEQKVYDGQSAL